MRTHTVRPTIALCLSASACVSQSQCTPTVDTCGSSGARFITRDQQECREPAMQAAGSSEAPGRTRPSSGSSISVCAAVATPCCRDAAEDTAMTARMLQLAVLVAHAAPAGAADDELAATLRGVAEEHARAYDAESTDGVPRTMHTGSPEYDPTATALPAQFRNGRGEVRRWLRLA